MRRLFTIMTMLGVVYMCAACAGGAGGGGLGSNEITNAQGAKIHPGMTEQAVRAALGKPESIAKSTMKLLGKKIRSDDYTYSGRGDSTWVFSFTNGKLDSKSHL